MPDVSLDAAFAIAALAFPQVASSSSTAPPPLRLPTTAPPPAAAAALEAAAAAPLQLAAVPSPAAGAAARLLRGSDSGISADPVLAVGVLMVLLLGIIATRLCLEARKWRAKKDLPEPAPPPRLGGEAPLGGPPVLSVDGREASVADQAPRSSTPLGEHLPKPGGDLEGRRLRFVADVDDEDEERPRSATSRPTIRPNSVGAGGGRRPPSSDGRPTSAGSRRHSKGAAAAAAAGVGAPADVGAADNDSRRERKQRKRPVSHDSHSGRRPETSDSFFSDDRPVSRRPGFERYASRKSALFQSLGPVRPESRPESRAESWEGPAASWQGPPEHREIPFANDFGSRPATAESCGAGFGARPDSRDSRDSGEGFGRRPDSCESNESWKDADQGPGSCGHSHTQSPSRGRPSSPGRSPAATAAATAAAAAAATTTSTARGFAAYVRRRASWSAPPRSTAPSSTTTPLSAFGVGVERTATASGRGGRWAFGSSSSTSVRAGRTTAWAAGPPRSGTRRPGTPDPRATNLRARSWDESAWRGRSWLPWRRRRAGRSDDDDDDDTASAAELAQQRLDETASGMLARLKETKREPLAVRRTVFRDLQRQLHPDKNVHCSEAATLAFQQLMELRSSYLRASCDPVF